MKPPQARKGWQWADGKYHDTPPPSAETMTVSEPPPSHDADHSPKVEAVIYPPVVNQFEITDRHRLRMMAFDMTLRSGHVDTRQGAAKLLAEAELLERWIAAANCRADPT